MFEGKPRQVHGLLRRVPKEFPTTKPFHPSLPLPPLCVDDLPLGQQSVQPCAQNITQHWNDCLQRIELEMCIVHSIPESDRAKYIGRAGDSRVVSLPLLPPPSRDSPAEAGLARSLRWLARSLRDIMHLVPSAPASSAAFANGTAIAYKLFRSTSWLQSLGPDGVSWAQVVRARDCLFHWQWGPFVDLATFAACAAVRAADGIAASAASKRTKVWPNGYTNKRTMGGKGYTDILGYLSLGSPLAL